LYVFGRVVGRGLLLAIARAAVRIGIVGMCGKDPQPYVFLGGVG